MEGSQRYQLFSIKYCKFITLEFIAGLLWAMGLWTMGVMLDDILPSLPRPLSLLTQPMTVQQRKDTNIRRI
jgi:membrane protein DedA with SNARE-associated domain